MNNIVQSYFLRKLAQIKEPLPIDYALQHLLANYNASIGQIAGMACMSLRSFERKCKERLGMTAKMYARIARFHKAYKMLEAKPTISRTDLAYEVGYYDHMHLIKDFKEFSKLTPSLVYKEISVEHMQFQFDYNKI